MTRALFALAVLLVACGKMHPTPDPTPCATRLMGALGAVTSHGEPWRGIEQPTALACPELYRHSTCGDAWKRELELSETLAKKAAFGPAEKLPDPARIARDCAKAYCSELASKPALCRGPAPSDNQALVLALTELDSAILAYELGDAAMAKGLAGRAMLFRVYSVPIEVPALPSASKADEARTVTLEIAVDERMTLDGKAVTPEALGQELQKLGDASNLRAVIRADRRVSHGRVITMIDVLKRAGVRKIAFGVETDAP